MATVSTPSGVRIWLMAARVRTLPAAIAPVLVGTSLAGHDGTFHALRFIAALLGAIFIQVGTNLSNDYSDARRGADTEDRLGPVRVTAGGLVPPRQVLIATYVSFGVAVLMGYGAFVIALLPWVFGTLSFWLLLSWLALPLAVPIVRTVAQRTDGPSLNEALARTGMVQLLTCVLLSAGVLLS